MSKEALKKEIADILASADNGKALAPLIESVVEALSKNGDALEGITYSYRLCASDTGYTRGFSINNGHCADIDEADEADAVVTATEANLLAIFRRQISPMSALLRGKIKLKGSKAALIRLGEFL